MAYIAEVSKPSLASQITAAANQIYAATKASKSNWVLTSNWASTNLKNYPFPNTYWPEEKGPETINHVKGTKLMSTAAEHYVSGMGIEINGMEYPALFKILLSSEDVKLTFESWFDLKRFFRKLIIDAPTPPYEGTQNEETLTASLLRDKIFNSLKPQLQNYYYYVKLVREEQKNVNFFYYQLKREKTVINLMTESDLLSVLYLMNKMPDRPLLKARKGKNAYNAFKYNVRERLRGCGVIEKLDCRETYDNLLGQAVEIIEEQINGNF